MKQINEIQRMQHLAGINEYKINNPGQSFYLVIDSEFPTELELVSDEKDEIYPGYIDDNIVTFSTNIENEDIALPMSREDIFNLYAPDIFKEMRAEGRAEGIEWDADDDYIDIYIPLAKLKELFQTR